MNLLSKTNRSTAMAMAIVGASYVVLYPHALLTDQPGWVWDAQGRNLAMEHMFIAVYACMGLFLIYGARDPERFLPFTDFVIVSGILHGTAMWVDAWLIPGESEHLGIKGDVVGTYWGPVLLIIFHPRRFYLPGFSRRAHGRAEG